MNLKNLTITLIATTLLSPSLTSFAFPPVAPANQPSLPLTGDQTVAKPTTSLFQVLARNPKFSNSANQSMTAYDNGMAVEPTLASGQVEAYPAAGKIGFRGMVFTHVTGPTGQHTFYAMEGDITKATAKNLVLASNIGGVETNPAGTTIQPSGSDSPTQLARLAAAANQSRLTGLGGTSNVLVSLGYGSLIPTLYTIQKHNAGLIPALVSTVDCNLQSSPNEGPVQQVPVRLSAFYLVEPNTGEAAWLVHLTSKNDKFKFPRTVFVVR